jgi:hypothetical protein
MVSIKNEMEIYSIDPSLDPDTGRDGEGVVTAITQEGTEVKFACPAFGMFEEEMTSHPRFIFGLTAIAYSVRKMDEEIFITEGQFFEHAKRQRLEDNPELDPASITSIPISLANMRSYMAHGEEGDFVFQSRVDEVVAFESLGVKGHILHVNLSSADSSPLRITVFAGKKALGDLVPKAGDLIDGVGWMLGVPLESVEVDKPWMDSVESSENGGLRAAAYAGASFMFSNRHMPLSWQIVGGAFVSAGWEVEASGTGLFRIQFPAFEFSRRNKRARVFIRSSIQGFCEAPEWPELVGLIEAESESKGVQCLRITVSLTPCGGKHFDVTVDGLGDFLEGINPVCGVGRPEFSQPVEIGQEEAPTAVFVESECAEEFVRAINSCTLSELSESMVEDFEYESRTTGKSVKGRDACLSYLGTLLGDWEEREMLPRCRLAKVVLDGIERTAALLYPKGESAPVNGAFFSGRNGFASSIQVLPPHLFDILKVEKDTSGTEEPK